MHKNQLVPVHSDILDIVDGIAEIVDLYREDILK